MISKEVLDKITETVTVGLQNIFGDKLHKVILYGSYARGEANDESDIDIIMIVDIPPEELWQYDKAICRMTSDLCLDYGVLVSVVTQNRQQFNDYLPILPFFQNVIQDGVELYAN